MARAAELALGEANEHRGHADHHHQQRFADSTDETRAATRGNADFDYADVEAGMVDPDDVVALMEEDDISLWGNDGVEGGRYQDDDGGERTEGWRDGSVSPNGSRRR